MECRPIEQERPNHCPSGVDVFYPASRPFDPGHRAAVTIPCCLGRRPSIPALPPFRICCSWPCRFYPVHPQPPRCWLTRRTSSLRAPLAVHVARLETLDDIDSIVTHRIAFVVSFLD